MPARRPSDDVDEFDRDALPGVVRVGVLDRVDASEFEVVGPNLEQLPAGVALGDVEVPWCEISGVLVEFLQGDAVDHDDLAVLGELELAVLGTELAVVLVVADDLDSHAIFQIANEPFAVVVGDGLAGGSDVVCAQDQHPASLHDVGRHGDEVVTRLEAILDLADPVVTHHHRVAERSRKEPLKIDLLEGEELAWLRSGSAHLGSSLC